MIRRPPRSTRTDTLIPYTTRFLSTTWLVHDQRFVDGRPDVLTWVSEPLTEPLRIAGEPKVHLQASTTGSDSDWVVKLIDVYPETVASRPEMGGYHLPLRSDGSRVGKEWVSTCRSRWSSEQ